MSEPVMPAGSTHPPVAGKPHSLGSGIEALRAKWGWIAGLGVLFIVAGLVALASVVSATVASVLVVGVMMFVSGLAEIMHAFAVKTWGRFFLWFLLGVLYVLAGAATFANPLLAAGILTLILGAALVASGILRIVLAFQMKEGTPWGLVVLSGVVTLGLGIMILMHWPASGLYVLGLLLGIDLIFAGSGWLMVGLGLRARK